MKGLYSRAIDATAPDGVATKIVVSMVYTVGHDPTIISHVWANKDYWGRGYASALFDQVLMDADHEQQTLMLDLQPDPGGLTNEELAAWFKRCGFKFIFETDDGSVPEDTTMERKPEPKSDYIRERRVKVGNG